MTKLQLKKFIDSLGAAEQKELVIRIHSNSFKRNIGPFN